jgi:hypothetical protein
MINIFSKLEQQINPRDDTILKVRKYHADA